MISRAVTRLPHVDNSTFINCARISGRQPRRHEEPYSRIQLSGNGHISPAEIAISTIALRGDRNWCDCRRDSPVLIEICPLADDRGVSLRAGR
jgi:hypothetical protein